MVLPSDGQNLHQLQPYPTAPQRLSPGHVCHEASLPGVAPARCGLRAPAEQTSVTPSPSLGCTLVQG